MRPGEKLFEELFVEGEGYGRTRHEKIFVAMNGRKDPKLDEQVEQLIALAHEGDESKVRRLLGAIVPEYRGTGESVLISVRAQA